MTTALEKLENIKELEAKKAKLYQELEVSLNLKALPQDVFKHGSCIIQWQAYHLGKWSLAVPNHIWQNPKTKVRARIHRGGVDFAFINESEMPLNLRKRRNPNYAV